MQVYNTILKTRPEVRAPIPNKTRRAFKKCVTPHGKITVVSTLPKFLGEPDSNFLDFDILTVSRA